MSKKPSRAQRKVIRAKSLKARALFVQQNPPPAPSAPSTANAETASSPNKPEPAPIAPKQVASRPAKRTASKPIAKAAEAAKKEERRDSPPPAAPAKKKQSPQNAIFAFVGLIAVAVIIAYFATRKPSAPMVQEDKPQVATAEKITEKPFEVAPKPVDLSPPTPVVVTPPPTPAAPPIATNDSSDKPTPSPEASAASADKPTPSATASTPAKPPTTTKTPSKPAPGRPAAPKTDDYE